MTFEEWAKNYFAELPAWQDTRTEYTVAKAAWEAGANNLRDKFAMAAMQGFCASGEYGSQSWFEDIAIDAYATADAMLKERLK